MKRPFRQEVAKRGWKALTNKHNLIVGVVLQYVFRNVGEVLQTNFLRHLNQQMGSLFDRHDLPGHDASFACPDPRGAQ